jgi:hypothetical protein
MLGKSLFGDAKGLALFGKGQITIVDIEGVVTVFAFERTGLADIDIQKTIPIDIGHADSCGPNALDPKSRFLGNVFKFEIAFVQVKAIRGLVACKENIDQAIVVDVAECDAGSIEKIAKSIGVELFGKGKIISEINPGMG